MNALARFLPDWKALRITGEWIARHQRDDGAIASLKGRRMDPWDHVQSAMALAVLGQYDAARAAFRYLAASQGQDGSWPASSNAAGVINDTRESNHAAYLATGLWHYYVASGDRGFLAEMWPTVGKALDFVLGLQADSGVVYWARDAQGEAWPAPLLAGCSSIHGSLGCAVRMARELGESCDRWLYARARLGDAIRHRPAIFEGAAVPEPPGRYAMDWYYPVLAGVVRGEPGRQRLIDGHGDFLDEGAGCRCVRDRAWYTVAETCELTIALHLSGLPEQARALYDWAQTLRCEDGGYWMGITLEDGLIWPAERPSWTAATVILAADALAGESPTSGFFGALA